MKKTFLFLTFAFSLLSQGNEHLIYLQSKNSSNELVIVNKDLLNSLNDESKRMILSILSEKYITSELSEQLSLSDNSALKEALEKKAEAQTV